MLNLKLELKTPNELWINVYEFSMCVIKDI